MAMRAFDDSTGWDTSYDETLYTVEGLAADDRVSPIGKELASHLETWDELDAERRKARRLTVRANARVRVVDARLDQVVSAIADALIALVGRNGHDDPYYKRFFPRPPSEIIKLALDAERDPVRKMMAIAAEKDTPASIKEACKPLAGILADAEKALAERTKAEIETARVAAKIAHWKSEANAQRLAVQAGLLDAAAKQRLSKTFADAYFPAPPPKKSKKAEAKAKAAADAKAKADADAKAKADTDAKAATDPNAKAAGDPPATPPAK